jgi:hypothetical protein
MRAKSPPADDGVLDQAQAPIRDHIGNFRAFLVDSTDTA